MGFLDWIRNAYQRRKNRLVPSLRSHLSHFEIKEALEKANGRVIDYHNEAKRAISQYQGNREKIDERLRYVKGGIQGMHDTCIALAAHKNSTSQMKEEIVGMSRLYKSYIIEIEQCLKQKKDPNSLVISINSGIKHLENRMRYLAESRGGIWEQYNKAQYDREQSQKAIVLYQSTIARLRKRMLLIVVYVEQNFGHVKISPEERARLLLQERRMQDVVSEFSQIKSMVTGISQRLNEEMQADKRYMTEPLHAVNAAVNGKIDAARLWVVMRATQAYLERVVPRETAGTKIAAPMVILGSEEVPLAAAK